MCVVVHASGMGFCIIVVKDGYILEHQNLASDFFGMIYDQCNQKMETYTI